MDKLSEYIPLLIILASFVISILGKKKKQGKITQKTTLPGKSVEDYYDFEEEKSPQTYSSTYQTFAEKKPNKPTILQPEIIQGKKVSSFSSAPLMLDSEEEEHSHFSLEDEEDLKRAIIYTEIINRKEY